MRPPLQTQTIKPFLPIGSKPQHNVTSGLREFVRQLGLAALITVAFYYTVGYVNTGIILWPWKYLELIYKELSLAFIYLLLLLYSQRFIAGFFRKIKAGTKGVLFAILEIALVLCSALLLFVLSNYIPLRWFYPDLDFEPVRLRTAFAFSALIALFLYYFVIGREYEKQLQRQQLKTAQLAKERYKSELQSLRQQVDPHFLFNSLNVLGSLIKSAPEKAALFNENLAEVYRFFLSFSREEFISLEREMEFLSAYAYLLKTRMGEALQFNIGELTSHQNYHLPPGALQTLVENAVKHNRVSRDEPLLITVEMIGDKVRVRNKLQERKGIQDHSGTGLLNLRSRYRILMGAEIDIERIEGEFMVTLPLLKKGT